MTLLPVLSLDIDGVLAAGGYVPPSERTYETYFDKGLVDPDLPRYLERLARRYQIHLTSHRGAGGEGPWVWDCTQRWLGRHGLDQLITELHLEQTEKSETVHRIGATYHVDDDPRVVYGCGPRGIVFETPFLDKFDIGFLTRLEFNPDPELETLFISTWKVLTSFLAGDSPLWRRFHRQLRLPFRPPPLDESRGVWRTGHGPLQAHAVAA